MTPRYIHFVRHGQGLHDLYNDQNIPDPDLTEHGYAQCEHLRDIFPYHDRIQLVCASPIRRTIQTALISFEPYLQSGKRQVLAIPRGQESSSQPSNTGHDPSTLKAEFGKLVDFSLVQEDWNSKEGLWAPDWHTVELRARQLRLLLRAREEKEIVVISHGNFLHHVTGNIDEQGRQTGGDWKNAEYRTYIFDPPDHEDALIQETEESYRARSADGPSEEMHRDKL
ncbi:phosphoglycerate mutase-like protein [Viridothelium virens]|uniref:Phosphoglycerate mutase-like protein n=1 Tax=Viridothelium virens TaxID=1048519 RepID=A0A6A6HC30_VIRVR|nr:phosphoglycerate mutase-like protein [Viridothelium virens]